MRSQFTYLLMFPFLFLLSANLLHGQGAISSWNLVDIPHGVANSGAPDYMAQWEVKHLDAQRGLIRVKTWPKNKPNCSAFADFSWNFSKDVGNVSQNDAIQTKIVLDLKPGTNCAPPLDPTLQLFVMKGVR